MLPESRAYSPAPDSYEASLWSKANREIFPEDIRKNPKGFKDQIFAWTGIVLTSRTEGNTIITDYEHHYWDWIEDFGSQRQKAFLSPRGEGKFRCFLKVENFGKDAKITLPTAGEIAIVYGRVEKVESNSVITLDCAPILKSLPPEKFATDIWDYGREYVLHKDKNDFKVLRVPLLQ